MISSKLLIKSAGLKRLLDACSVEYDGNLTITVPSDGFLNLLLEYKAELACEYHGCVQIVLPSGEAVCLSRSNAQA